MQIISRGLPLSQPSVYLGTARKFIPSMELIKRDFLKSITGSQDVTFTYFICTSTRNDTSYEKFLDRYIIDNGSSHGLNKEGKCEQVTRLTTPK